MVLEGRKLKAASESHVAASRFTHFGDKSGAWKDNHSAVQVWTWFQVLSTPDVSDEKFRVDGEKASSWVGHVHVFG